MWDDEKEEAEALEALEAAEKNREVAKVRVKRFRKYVDKTSIVELTLNDLKELAERNLEEAKENDSADIVNELNSALAEIEMLRDSIAEFRKKYSTFRDDAQAVYEEKQQEYEEAEKVFKSKKLQKCMMPGCEKRIPPNGESFCIEHEPDMGALNGVVNGVAGLFKGFKR
ncbi:MAG: hypothetical protein Q4P78_02595 [Rothia sp. (in: high G+C Gram-positive bacteria)]|uniref:hypothetical protein n=1 Tax=Rothia sp. (in: high G+C Gram-positive bacteria) TaxID=1885016 RepID=UPI0026E028DB|nr:hypothetical protein [Rothia sp. (in: high G+C Gram-positive bacteria)]MDO5750077.1 hypothetical protein [Rothia sp. (in: high G+C Gram-positive bacteria)]